MSHSCNTRLMQEVRMRVVIFCAGAVATTLMATAASAAEKSTKKQAAVYRELLECRAITNDAARLACFDGTVTKFAAAESQGEVLIADRAQVEEAGRKEFGFGGMRIPFLEGDDAKMPSQIEATLAGVRDLGRGKWEFTLDNGMRWRQTDDDEIFPKVGDAVTVRTAALGSYMLKIRTRAVRVIRIK